MSWPLSRCYDRPGEPPDAVPSCPDVCLALHRRCSWKPPLTCAPRPSVHTTASQMPVSMDLAVCTALSELPMEDRATQSTAHAVGPRTRWLWTLHVFERMPSALRQLATTIGRCYRHSVCDCTFLDLGSSLIHFGDFTSRGLALRLQDSPQRRDAISIGLQLLEERPCLGCRCSVSSLSITLLKPACGTHIC